MGRDLPPYRQSPWEPEPEPSRRHASPLLIFGIALFAVAAFYVLLIVVTAADSIFFPGNEIRIGIKLPGVDSGDSPEGRINILFLGLDLRLDEPAEQPARTDSVFVATIDPDSRTAGVFSIPRDLVVYIPSRPGGCSGGRVSESCIQDRINVAYELGETTFGDFPGRGPGLAKATVEENFGIPIDYYVVLNFNNFIQLIDDLGGIDIEVPEYAYDASYSEYNVGPAYPVEFLPGPEHMDGQRALAYARIRKSDNDFKRMERQQLVMRATARKALDLGILTNNPVSLFKSYKESVNTDIPDFKIPGLALLASQIGVDRVRMVSIASATYPCPNCPAAVLLADWEKVNELRAIVFGDGRLQAENAVVEVQNGTASPGLAEQFAAFLTAKGVAADHIAIDEYANGAIYDSTMIVDLSGKSYTAELLAEWLGLPSGRVIQASDPEAMPFLSSAGDVVLVLGADASLPSSVAAPGG